MFVRNSVIEDTLERIDSNERLLKRHSRMQHLIARRWGTDDKRERAKLRVKINALHDSLFAGVRL